MMTSQRRRGYTLTEALLVVAILGVLATAAAPLLVQVNRFFMQNRARTAIQGEARAAMYVISRNLHQAQQSSIVIDNAANQPYCSRITFHKIQDPLGTNWSFYQNNNQLVQKMGNNMSVLSSNLRYLAFTFPRTDDMGIVSVSLTLQKGTYQYLGQAQYAALHMASQKVEVMNQ